MDSIICYTCGAKAVGDRKALIDSGWKVLADGRVLCESCYSTRGIVPDRLITDITTEKLIIATNLKGP